MTEGVDYSWTRPEPFCLKQAGKHFAVRYVGTSQSSKNLSPAETSRLQRAGVDLAAVYQTTKGFMADGASGSLAAGRAHSNAVFCGMPVDRPIYFALDTDPAGLSPVEWDRVEAFLRDAGDVLSRNRVGVYGGFEAIERLVPRFAVYGWQTFAWSRGRLSSRAHLYQYRNGVNACGGTVDFCRSLADDFGQWSYQPAEPLPPPTTEEDMPYLHASQWTGVHVIDASGATWLRSDASVSELLAQGVRVLRMDADEDDARRYLADRNASTDEQTLASEQSQQAYLAAIAGSPEA